MSLYIFIYVIYKYIYLKKILLIYSKDSHRLLHESTLGNPIYDTNIS